MPPRYNKLREDMGKGRQTLRSGSCSLILANGTVRDVVAAPPAPFVIKRVLVGSQVATDLTSLDVLVLAPTADLDTAAAAGNRVIASQASIADKKLNEIALTAVGTTKQAAGSVIVAEGIHNAAVPTGPVKVIVEYDIVGQTYGAYDGDGDSTGAYD